jgi:DNA primase (bacterial type)
MTKITEHNNLIDQAIHYHESLPRRIRAYLNGRGIPDELTNSHLLGWNGWRITIPIYNRKGEVVFFKLAKDPEDTRPLAKMLCSPGATVELYGWDRVIRPPEQIIICEGEFDRLVLEAHGFAAVTGTGGAATFRPEWAEEIKPIPHVFVCFDRDEAGRNGAMVVSLMIPHAKVVEWPEEVGKGGDVTDFFVRLRHSREDFLRLLDQAHPIQPVPQATHEYRLVTQRTGLSATNRIGRIKCQIPIDTVIAQYVKLRPSGSQLVGLCPFHEDHNPSLAVYPATGTFHCYGCSKHGDVISFVQEAEHVTFPQALEVLEEFNHQ